MKIDKETMAVLDRCIVMNHDVVLPAGQLPRPLYAKVDKVLRAAGGKWDRKVRSHVFADDATEVIEQALLTGEIGNPKQELGIFYTPPGIARRAAQALRLDHTGVSVLEPSAGRGALAQAVRDEAGSDPETCSWASITCVDIVPAHCEALQALGFIVREGDFLLMAPVLTFERIIMNPPFAKQADARHFLHALDFLEPGGRIVSIMSAAVTFRETAMYSQIRDLIAEGGMGSQIIPLPANSFKESGTGVNTVMVIYDKPK